MGFSRQAYWSGLPFPSPGDLPDPGTEPGSPSLAGVFFATESPGKLDIAIRHDKNWLELASSKTADSLALSRLWCLSHLWLFMAPWAVSCWVPLFKDFSSEECWSGLPFPTPGEASTPWAILHARACVLSLLSYVRLSLSPWAVARQAPLSMEFSRQEYGVGCHTLPKGSSRPRDWTHISELSCTGRQALSH